MVDQRYLLEQPPAPTGLRAVVTPQVVPILVDAMGAVEVRLEVVAKTVRRAPATSLLVAAGIGALLAQMRQSHAT